jgi:hypothetical protein
MRGRYKLNIFRSPVLQFKKYITKSLTCDDFAESSRAYLRILTVHTPQTAARKKYRACAVFAGYAWFFPLVQSGFRRLDFRAHTAESNGFVSVNSAFSRTQATRGIFREHCLFLPHECVYFSG